MEVSQQVELGFCESESKAEEQTRAPTLSEYVPDNGGRHVAESCSFVSLGKEM